MSLSQSLKHIVLLKYFVSFKFILNSSFYMVNPDTTILHSDTNFPEQSEVTSRGGGEEMDDEKTESFGNESDSELEEC